MNLWLTTGIFIFRIFYLLSFVGIRTEAKPLWILLIKNYVFWGQFYWSDDKYSSCSFYGLTSESREAIAWKMIIAFPNANNCDSTTKLLLHITKHEYRWCIDQFTLRFQGHRSRLQRYSIPLLYAVIFNVAATKTALVYLHGYKTAI